MICCILGHMTVDDGLHGYPDSWWMDMLASFTRLFLGYDYLASRELSVTENTYAMITWPAGSYP